MVNTYLVGKGVEAFLHNKNVTGKIPTLLLTERFDKTKFGYTEDGFIIPLLIDSEFE